MDNYKNFPKVRQLGEDSACFICQEMEVTWGQQHLAVLSEDEAQCWLLGVSYYYVLFIMLCFFFFFFFFFRSPRLTDLTNSSIH